MLPLISIIIPTYRRSDYLTRAIDSALNQTYPHIEIIIIDDNHPESQERVLTEKVMKSYTMMTNITYICHPYNKNGAAARNTGLNNSHGDYVCFLDDDDWYLPAKVELQYNYLKVHPEFDAVYCGWERAGKKVTPYKSGDLTFELLSGTDVIYTNTIMMKHDKAVACGGWDERFRRNQEAVFLLRFFSKGGKIAAIPDILVQFDISDASNRSNPIEFEKDFDMFLELHANEIEHCTLRYHDAREIIYSYRYRGVLLNYLKHGYVTQALHLYLKMTRLLPNRFRNDVLIYMKRKILRQTIFEEFK